MTILTVPGNFIFSGQSNFSIREGHLSSHFLRGISLAVPNTKNTKESNGLQSPIRWSYPGMETVRLCALIASNSRKPPSVSKVAPSLTFEKVNAKTQTVWIHLSMEGHLRWPTFGLPPSFTFLRKSYRKTSKATSASPL